LYEASSVVIASHNMNPSISMTDCTKLLVLSSLVITWTHPYQWQIVRSF